jgi:hypothetical protein
MNELSQRNIGRKYGAKISIGEEKPNFFKNTYKIKILLTVPLDKQNLKLDAFRRKYSQSSNIAADP